ncbi:hypothetical protein GCM10008090_21080 [Arenicella chitinivorans]|uniref:Uncharacterized protein n=1 Tax=Arenicella chitinivorans TaxID=1329800 RepID=A0A918VLJ2_9GAMM|nr:hypothetical protein [Arenicella chitinivorans]GHA11105.1 hypothetical protein GCM10008090_21080 [Arenicella chitinivorans]
MSTVFCYGFEGVFDGSPEYEYRYSEIGKLHKCIIFLYQTDATLDFGSAEIEIAKFGFTQIRDLQGNQLKIESLNSPHSVKFQPYFEEALNHGSSFAIYESN